MNRKLKSTLGLVGLLVFILIAGGVYIFAFQRSDIKEKKAKLTELNSHDFNTARLTQQYNNALKRAAVLDSILAKRKFNIPENLSSIKFYDFMNELTAGYSPLTQMDIEYVDQKPDKEFFYHEYKISGGGQYNDLYNLIYAIEHSKQLKKIKSLTLGNLLSTDKEGMPHFLVSFIMQVDVYFSTNDRFSTNEFVENNLSSRELYDVFYPLIRNEIPPNVDELLDVQGAKLLALIPEGAFVADSRGNTYLLWEGEQVYLGYLTKIDYEHNKVSFILNKGGIIEKVDLFLEEEKSGEQTKRDLK